MIQRLDHLVLTCGELSRTAEFYRDVLGMQVVERDGRTALHFGNQQINLHQRGREIEPHAWSPTPGAGDLCFVTEQTTEWWLEHLLTAGVVIVEGPVQREGALGQMTSVYFRDPDGTLLEVSRYPTPGESAPEIVT